MKLNTSIFSQSVRVINTLKSNTNLASRSSYQCIPGVVCVFKPSISSRTCVRQNSTEEPKAKQPFYKRIFGGKSQDQIDHEKEIAEKVKDEEAILREIEIEEREAKIRKKQNRSKLHYSHRNILKGEPPQVGLHMEWDDSQMTRTYKAQMLGQFGRAKTGIDPSICWPTPEEMAEEYEKERVLYDNISLTELIQNDKRKQEEEKQSIKLREKEIDEKLARMNIDLTAWKTRIDSRKRLAQKEIDKRTKILAELRQEFGYDVNSNVPQFAEKYAAKEKEYAKKAKEDKKREKDERVKSFQEMSDKEAS